MAECTPQGVCDAPECTEYEVAGVDSLMSPKKTRDPGNRARSASEL